MKTAQKTLAILAFSLVVTPFVTLPVSAQTPASTSQSTVELKKVGSFVVPANLIFVETDQTKPTFSGTAPASAMVTVEINGVKNETQATANGTWEWTPTTPLTAGDLDLKVSSGTQSRAFRLKVTPATSGTTTPSTSEEATPAASPSPSPSLAFGETVPASTSPDEEVVTDTTPPATPSNPLQAYLPFILGGLAIGVILLIISRILKPKQTVLSEMPTPTEPTPAYPQPTPETVPPVQNTWSPSAPTQDVAANPAPMAEPVPQVSPVVPESLGPGTTIQPNQGTPLSPTEPPAPDQQPK